MTRTSDGLANNRTVDRRRFLCTAIGTRALCGPLGAFSMQLAPSLSKSLTKEQRDGMTQAQVIDELKKGMSDSVLRKWRLGIISQRSDPARLGNTQQWSCSDVLIPECPPKSYSMQELETPSSDALQAMSSMTTC